MAKSDTSKTNLIKIALLSLAALSVTVFGTFAVELFHPSSWWLVGFLALGLVATWLLVGFRPRLSVDGLAATQIMAVYILFYLILIYLLGLVTGFLRSGYDHTPLMILQNTLPIIGVTVLSELWRYGLVKRIGDHRWMLAIVALLFGGIQIVTGVVLYNPGAPLELFEMIGRLVLGGLASSALLTFVAYKTDFRPTLVYALVLALYPLLVPVLPDLGSFIYAVLAIVLPLLLIMRFNEFFATRRPIPDRHQHTGRIVRLVPLVAVLATMVVLISGIFRYWAMAIGSDSMSPDINVGDVVIIDKERHDLANTELGSVLAFWHDGRVVTHRLIDIKHDAHGLRIQTKGDNNNSNDAWLVRESDVVGVVRWRLPLIGWPTVWLNRVL